MARRSRTDWGTIRAQALLLLEHGASVREVAKEARASEGTVRRWKRRWAALCTASRSGSTSESESVRAMLRREAPAVARMLLDQAKGGDVRAAGLVMKLLGTSLNSEASEDGESGATSSELERELDSLPPSVAYEIVGLLAQVGSATAGGGAVVGETAGEGGVGSVRLPWQEDDPASDDGGEAL